MSAVGRYGGVLRTRYVPRLLVSSMFGRMPIGIDSLALVLFVRERTGSFVAAGITAASFAAGGALFAPVQGRLVDRHGQRKILLPLTLFHAAALLAVVSAGLLGAPIGLVAGFAFIAGAAIPPISAVLRLLWPALLPADRPELLTTAYALDAVLIEFVFVFGPLITAFCVAVFSPQAAILVAIVCVLGGTLAFVTSRPSREWKPSPHAGSHGPWGALSAPGLRTIVLTVIPLGFGFGSIEVALPAFARANGSPGLAGLYIAVWSLGSAAGGLTWGAIGENVELRRGYLVLTGLVAVGFLPLAAASSPEVMLVLLVPAGLCIAPMIAAGNQLISRVAPEGALTEAYTWPTLSLVIGVAIGNAVAGVLSEHVGWEAAMLAAAGVAFAGTIIANVRRETLRGAMRERPAASA